jgi:hypothetical protein
MRDPDPGALGSGNTLTLDGAVSTGGGVNQRRHGDSHTIRIGRAGNRARGELRQSLQ